TTPTVQLAGTAQDVDLGVLLPGSGRTDEFAGEFALIGRGSSLDTFEGEVALDLTRAEIGLPNHRLRLASTQIDADVFQGTIGFDADVALADGQGRAQGTGTLELGQPLRYAVEDGQATNLNLAAITGNPSQDSDLTGSFTLSGEGANIRQAPIDLTADLGPSRYGAFDLAGGVLEVELREGTANIDANLDFGAGGQLTAVGTAEPFVQPLAYDLSGTMQNLDLAVVQKNPDRASDLTGTYTASGAGLDPATLALDASVQITEPSSYGARLIDSADLDVTLDQGFLTVDGVAATPEGEFDLALSGSPFGPGGPAFAFEQTCFRGLDASDFAEAAPRTRLNGCFSGSLSGLADLPTADADGIVTLQPSIIGDAEIDDGRLVFALEDGALAGTLDLEVLSPRADAGVEAGGRIVAAFEGRPFQDEISYAVRGRTEGLDAAALLDLPPEQPLRFTTTFDLSGRGTDPETLVLEGSLETTSSTVGPVALEALTAEFAMADGVVRVDTLALESDLLVARGGGTLALFNDTAASSFTLEGGIESLAPFAAQTERTLGLERGTFALQASARPGDPLRILGTAEARQVVVDDYAVTGLDASMNVTWDRADADSLGLEAFQGQVRTSFAVLSGPTFRVQEGQATLQAEDGDVVVDGSVLVDDRRDLDVFARVDLETNGITLERGRFRLDDTTWQLLQPAGIAFDGTQIDIRGLLAASASGGQQVAADGTIDLEGEQNLIVTVEGLAIGALTDFVNLDALGGDLSATIVLSGPAAAPVLEGDMRLDELTSNGRVVGALQADVDYADGTLALDTRLTHVEGEDLTVVGTIPVQFALADSGVQTEESGDRNAVVSLRARSDAFPIAWAQPFLAERGYTDIGGTLRLDLTIEGTQGTPRLDGVATLSDGRLGVVATGRTYQPVEADLTFQNDRIVLDDVRVLEGGRVALDVGGSITLRELSVGELDLTITPSNFVAMDTRTYDGLTLDRGSQPLRLTGTLDRPVLRGSVVLA
ncbi:hypothetical protein, partial [Rubrivirga sp.]|uniref:translocation/assembly module TamB domain-containing protein n=1 Tax=Rubrivirga sp. TaxID=1885344 RepID=UPI003C726082